MLPAINDGDRMLVSSDVSAIERGDIILFRYPVEPEKRYMKRVIGLPGESLLIQGGKVFINGQALEEPYVDPGNNHSDVSESAPIPAGHYFVMGDNRDNSSDSRVWGTLDKALIEGKFYTSY